jgi:hypothetical protein
MGAKGRNLTHATPSRQIATKRPNSKFFDAEFFRHFLCDRRQSNRDFSYSGSSAGDGQGLHQVFTGKLRTECLKQTGT